MRMLLAMAVILARNVSAIASCRYSRDPATQLCPDAAKIPAIDPFTALSISASSKTMKGDLPPSSSDSSAKFSAVLRITWPAETGPPVKDTRATSGCDVRTRPHGSPRPVMIFTTPSGMPASAISLPNSRMGAALHSDPFSTTVLPAASAGPTFTAVRNSCEFHGTMAATTPSGSRLVKTNMSGLSIGRVLPSILSAAPA